MHKTNRCVHYENEMRRGAYVDCKIDGIQFGFCHKCFRRMNHKKGIEVIRYVVYGMKLEEKKQLAAVPF